MAYGELKLTGDEVLDALTDCNARTQYERRLNDDGERLAMLVADRVFAILKAKLARDLVED